MQFRSKQIKVSVRSILCGFILLSLSLPAGAQDSLWALNYGGVFAESAGSLVRLTSGDLVLCGSTYSYGAGDHDIYVVRTDSVGTTVWAETFGGSGTEYGRDIQKTSDGGFVIVGSTTSTGAGNRDVYIVKIDSTGSELWSKTYGGTSHDDGASIRELYDGGFIVCGTTESFGTGTDMYLIRTDSNGDSLWTKTYGGSSGESGAAVRVTADSGFVLIGNTGSYGTGYSSMYAVRTDSIGDTLWTATYGNDRADLGATVELTSDNGFIFGGTTVEDGENYYDAYVVKTDSLGVLEWDSAYGGAYEDRIYSIQTTPDGGYILGGASEASGARKMDVLLIKIDGGGNTEWQDEIGGNETDACRAIILDSQNDYVCLGYTYSSTAGSSDLYLVKYQRAGATAVDEDGNQIPDHFVVLEQNYPNPFNLQTTIEFSLPSWSEYRLTIYNILGQVVRSWEKDFVPAGSYTISWDGRDAWGDVVASGIYLYRLEAGECMESKKMVLLK
ncbi:MAG: T9SS type A sorting domain-containing protein [Candidatus Zixiibacteriota bacterium]